MNTFNPALVNLLQMGVWMRRFGISLSTWVLVISSIPLSAQEGDKAIEVRPTGYFMTDGGYLAEHDDVTLRTWKNEYFTNLIGGLRLYAEPSERFSLVVNPELRSHNIFPIRPGVKQGELVQRTKYDIYLEEAKGTWALGDPAAPRGRIEFGFMQFVDNPDAKVLGNYLFRAMIYPAMPFTKMDNNAAYLFGLRGGYDFLGGKLKNDVFVLSEVQRYPYYDIHLAYTASYAFRNLLEVGLGVQAKSILPARPSRTTPQGIPSEGGGLPENTYKYVPFQDSTPIMRNGKLLKTIWVGAHPNPDSAAGFAIVRIKDSTGVEALPYIVKRDGNGISGMSGGKFNNLGFDDLTVVGGGSGDLYPELRGTNTHYSFAGTILGGRIALNPMGFLGEENPLGKDALKIYSEIAVLGWKNYVGFYDNRSQRTPIMFGVNLPTFNYLDFLSLEVQRFTSQELPTFDLRAQLNVPQPGTHKEGQEEKWDEERRKKDDLKWVVTAKRTFGGWGLSMQAGTDHTKLMDDGDNDFYDAMTRPSHWYTQVRFFAGIR